MSTKVLMDVEEYLHTSFEHDCEYLAAAQELFHIRGFDRVVPSGCELGSGDVELTQSCCGGLLADRIQPGIQTRCDSQACGSPGGADELQDLLIAH